MNKRLDIRQIMELRRQIEAKPGMKPLYGGGELIDVLKAALFPPPHKLHEFAYVLVRTGEFAGRMGYTGYEQPSGRTIRVTLDDREEIEDVYLKSTEIYILAKLDC